MPISGAPKSACTPRLTHIFVGRMSISKSVLLLSFFSSSLGLSSDSYSSCCVRRMSSSLSTNEDKKEDRMGFSSKISFKKVLDCPCNEVGLTHGLQTKQFSLRQ
ncbi:unnamed protein product [Haemonchus placei]|uniref:Uncharacterized protein n=1 Tax=Haemonchus placei TaxID=6290 RepID=A0A3P7WLW8_HAEPC|nr:unnamed protein product [Haemonchus placei]